MKLKFKDDFMNFSGDISVFFVKEEQVFPESLQELAKIYKAMQELGDFKGELAESFTLYPSQLESLSCTSKRILLLGLGKDMPERDAIRELGGLLAQKAASVKGKDIQIILSAEQSKESFIEPLIEGLSLGDYRFCKYQKQPEDAFTGIESLAISFLENKDDSFEELINGALLAASCAKEARDMAHEPGSSWTPTHFARYAKVLAAEENLSCAIIEQKEMKTLGMGGLLGVNRGSKAHPKLIVLEYRPEEKAEKTLLMVGKGLTFDSGGVSLKPGAGMEEMKYDMCGGAAVITAMKAIAKEKPNVAVCAIIPATDNMGGGGALKPGDIITHYGGKTAEVINTDAEGRLILADALAYGCEQFSPDYVIDLATLTGAAIIALGHHHTALVSNNDDFTSLVNKAAEKAGEPVWRLPLNDAYRKQIKSDFADIKNVGGRPAGTIAAAAYLENFIGKTPWVHLDIAGTAWNFTEKKYIPKGASGTGTRTLIELVRSLG